MVRLQDENKLLFLSDKVFGFLKEFEQHEDSARVALLKLQYVYFKSDDMYDRIKERFAANGKPVDPSVYICDNSTSTIGELVNLVQLQGTS